MGTKSKNCNYTITTSGKAAIKTIAKFITNLEMALFENEKANFDISSISGNQLLASNLSQSECNIIISSTKNNDANTIDRRVMNIASEFDGLNDTKVFVLKKN